MSGMRTLSSKLPCSPPTVIATSLPITCAPTCMTTSGITGLTLPGMIDEPFCSSGRKISPMPARGPEPISARSLAIFVSDTATTFSAPDSSTSASRLACASNGSSGAEISRPLASLSARPDALGELGVRVQPVADGGAAERDLRDLRQRVAHAPRAEAHLRGVAGELLAERHRHGVHEVRAAGLHDVLELRGLGGERRLEVLERGQQRVRRLVERGEVDGAREHVVGRLAHVHVVVGMHALAGEVRDDLVGVHVRRGARAGLEDVDRELVVVLAGGDVVGRRADPLGEVGVELAEVGVDARGGALDRGQPAHDADRHALTGDGEVLDRLGRLAAPQLLLSHAHLTRPSRRRSPWRQR